MGAIPYYAYRACGRVRTWYLEAFMTVSLIFGDEITNEIDYAVLTAWLHELCRWRKCSANTLEYVINHFTNTSIEGSMVIGSGGRMRQRQFIFPAIN